MLQPGFHDIHFEAPNSSVFMEEKFLNPYPEIPLRTSLSIILPNISSCDRIRELRQDLQNPVLAFDPLSLYLAHAQQKFIHPHHNHSEIQC